MLMPALGLLVRYAVIVAVIVGVWHWEDVWHWVEGLRGGRNGPGRDFLTLVQEAPPAERPAPSSGGRTYVVAERSEQESRNAGRVVGDGKGDGGNRQVSTPPSGPGAAPAPGPGPGPGPGSARTAEDASYHERYEMTGLPSAHNLGPAAAPAEGTGTGLTAETHLHWIKARAAFWEKDYAEAERLYLQLKADHPGEAAFSAELGNLYHFLGRMDDAGVQFLGAGRRAVERGDIALARSLIDPLADLAPDQADILRRLVAKGQAGAR